MTKNEIKNFLENSLDSKYLKDETMLDILVNAIEKDIEVYIETIDDLKKANIFTIALKNDLPKTFYFMANPKNNCVISNPEFTKIFRKAIKETFENNFKSKYKTEEDFLKAQDDYVLNAITKFADETSI